MNEETEVRTTQRATILKDFLTVAYERTETVNGPENHVGHLVELKIQNPGEYSESILFINGEYVKPILEQLRDAITELLGAKTLQ